MEVSTATIKCKATCHDGKELDVSGTASSADPMNIRESVNDRLSLINVAMLKAGVYQKDIKKLELIIVYGN